MNKNKTRGLIDRIIVYNGLKNVVIMFTASFLWVLFLPLL